MLVLLNGPPASGKSTLARAWAEARPLSLALDIDVIRSLLGRWRDDPLGAGTVARELALTLVSAHLRAGHDVIVPQYLSRPEFIEKLAASASSARVPFVEIALVIEPAVAEERFAARAEALKAGAVDLHGPLVGGSMAEVISAHREFLAGRDHVVILRPDVPRGFVSLAALESAVTAALSAAATRAEAPRGGRRGPQRIDGPGESC